MNAIQEIETRSAKANSTNDFCVFFSYAGADRRVAAQIVQGLRASGLVVWWDQDDIGWGDNWLDKLQGTLSACSAYLILVGASGVRRWVKAEFLVATRRHFEEDLRIFPILMEEVAPDGLPPFLSIFQAKRLPKDLEQFDFDDLAAQVRAGSGVAEDAHTMTPEGSARFQASKPSMKATRRSSLAAKSRPSMRCGDWAMNRMAPIAVGYRSRGRAGSASPLWSERGSCPP